MNWLLSVDDFLIDKARSLSKFCWEWFSISRLMLMRIVFAMSCVMQLVGDLILNQIVFSVVLFACVLYMCLSRDYHDSLKATPKYVATRWIDIAFRIYLLSCSVVNGVDALISFKTTHRFVLNSDVAYCVCYALLTVAFYIAAAGGDQGERGRKRKLAKEKLIELFGSSWLPAPTGA